MISFICTSFLGLWFGLTLLERFAYSGLSSYLNASWGEAVCIGLGKSCLIAVISFILTMLLLGVFYG